MEFKDYYQKLGLKRGASEDEVRQAYRRLARKYHPDVSKEHDAESRMREINEAYEVLRDTERRSAYDRLAEGAEQSARGGFEPPPGWQRGFDPRQHAAGSESSAEFSDFFSSFFGSGGPGVGARGPGRSARAQGEDHSAVIEIELEDAIFGAQRDINLRTLDDRRATPRTRTLNVRIPAGIQSGQKIRLAGQGYPGRGGAAAGNLYLEIRIKPHRLYKIAERDLYLTLPITPWEAALGASVRAPSPAGAVDVSIPAGSQNGRKLRLRGRGIPGKTPGDLYLVLDIVAPPAKTDAARAAYKQLAEAAAFDPRAALGG